LKKVYTIGIDFGTESGRVLLVDVSNGEEIATHETHYSFGVIDKELPNGMKLNDDWALQDPRDYLNVLFKSIPKVISLSNIHPKDVIGIGIDFTSCTVIPLNKSGDPLSFDPRWKDNPHSWAKLWKHHAAQDEADFITRVADQRKEPFLIHYGGKVSSEWMFPKILQILREAPEIYNETDIFLEACDWITYKLTNNLIRSASTTGYKALWNKTEGYPSSSFFKAVDYHLENIVETKMRGSVIPIGQKAGELTEEMANILGLLPGTSVSVGIIDAHAGVPAVGAVHPGQLVLTMGTSNCLMIISDKKKTVDGICGVVEDGIIPRYFGYETGQVAVGDSFAWYLEQAVPDSVIKQAKHEGKSVHQILEEKASKNRPGQSGLIALDWWNGNRSVLVDANLSGLILGFTLGTKPEEIYRALLESTAFGTRKIIESLTDAGIEINELFACGGLPHRNHLLMQIYADVTNREIKIADSRLPSALGTAMYASVAAGRSRGGYDTITEAAKYMSKIKEESFKPILANVEIYNELYKYYVELHDYFGREEIHIMHGLKKMRISI
jgi:L-ribulokinase